MKYDCGLSSTKLEIICLAVNQVQVTPLIGHVTELLFKSKIPHIEEDKLPPNAKIQETTEMVSLRFETIRFTR